MNSGPRSGLAASSRHPFSGADTACAQRAAARAGSLRAPTVGGGPAPRSEVTSAARKARQSPRSSAESGWEWWANWSSAASEEARATSRVGLFFFFCSLFSLGESEGERAAARREESSQSNLPLLVSCALSFRYLLVEGDQTCSKKSSGGDLGEISRCPSWTFREEH